MKIVYELTTNYGGGLFENENDAIHALQMFGSYHDKVINKTDVKTALEKEGYYENWPLSIRKCED